MDGFLARWSARKHAARRHAEATDARQAPPERCAVPTPDLDALPKLEDLRPDTDIRGFLQPGVPASLRNAALRKMWTLDPAIRDFVGHARDYAYDWNTPGGVPGNAPLGAQEVAALLARFVGSRLREADPPEAASEATPADRSTLSARS